MFLYKSLDGVSILCTVTLPCNNFIIMATSLTVIIIINDYYDAKSQAYGFFKVQSVGQGDGAVSKLQLSSSVDRYVLHPDFPILSTSV